MLSPRPHVVILVALLGVALAGCPRPGGTLQPRSRFDAPTGGDPKAKARFEDARARFERQDATAGAELAAIARDFPQDPVAPVATLYAGMDAWRRGDAAATAQLLAPLDEKPGLPEDVAVRVRWTLGLAEVRLGKRPEAVRHLSGFVDKVEGDEAVELYGALSEATGADPVLDGRAALRYTSRFHEAGRPAEKAWAEARLAALVAGLPSTELEAAWDEVDHDGPAAAYLGRRLASEAKDRASAQRWLDGSAGARSAYGVDAPTGGAEDPALVGAILPLTGKRRLVGEAALKGLAAAAGTYGALEAERGGMAAFTLVVEDAAAAPADALAGLAERGAIGVVGPVTRDAAEEAARRAESLGVPMISLDVGEEALGQGAPHVFRIAVSVEARARQLARALSRRGAKTAAILAPELGYGERAGRAFEEEWLKLGGKIATRVTYAKDATSFVPQVKKLGASTFDAIFIPDQADRVELIAPQLASEGLMVGSTLARKPKRGRPVLLASTAEALAPKFLRGSGRYTEGALFAPGYYPDDLDPVSAPFVALYRAAHGEEPTYLAAYAWDAALVLRKAVDGGARTRREVVNEIAASEVRGLTGTIKWDTTRQRADGGLVYQVVPASAGAYAIRVLAP